MKADLTRRTFDPLKHFTRVLMQQGRVQLDADWNEQTAILLHYLRALAADLIGPHGGPVDHLGFAISPLATGAAQTPISNDFVIGYGNYYVDGILCEVDSKPIPITGFLSGDPNTLQVLYWPQDDLAFREKQYVEVSNDVPSSLRARITKLNPVNRTLTLNTNISGLSDLTKHPRALHLTTYLTQPDYPVPSDNDLQKGRSYLVYLDVWERLITYVEDDSIREVALDGPDTTARSKIVWQVKVWSPPDGSSPTCVTVPDSVQARNRGWLKAMAKQETTSTDPCIIAPSARYRGPENQLYRVEIHQPGSAWDGKGVPPANAATFKWSRENGSAFSRITNISGTKLTLESLGRDDRFGLAEGDWVEIVDDDYVLQNRAEPLLKVHAIDRTSMTVTLDGAPQSNVGQYSAKHPLLRRWDQKEGDPAEGGLNLTDGAALIIEDTWLELEDGIKIQFQNPDDKQPANQYRTGDYWLIPARTATRDIEWPKAKDAGGNLITDSDGNPIPIAKPPAGITHHYAPLAVITVGPDGSIVANPTSCQKPFKHITEFPAM